MKRESAGAYQVAWILVVVMGGCEALSAGGVEANEGPSCQDWNTKRFFASASLEKVTACLEAGADPNARASFSRETPLYPAKKRTEPNPEVIAALEQAGAESPWIEIMFFKYVSLPIVTALAVSAFRRWRRTARPTPSGQETIQPV